MAEDPSAPGEQDGPAPEPGAERQGLGESGAPVPADAVDPDLVRLPRPRLRRSPVLALAVVALGGLLLYRLREDLRYALQPAAPAELGEARAADPAGLVPGRHVALRGMPDLRNALHFEAKGDRARTQLFRVLGTGSRLLVVTPGLDGRGDFQPRFAGRLRRFEELPYAGSVRAYYQREARVLRALDLGRLQALPPGPLPTQTSLPDRAGEPLQLRPGDELLLRVGFPDDVRVLLSQKKFPSEPDARHEVERLGLPMGPAVQTRDGFGYVVRVPAGAARNQALGRIDAQGMLFQGRVEVYRAPVSAVAVGPEGVRLPGPEPLRQPVRYQVAAEAPGRLVAVPPTPEVVLAWSDLQAAEISEPLSLPREALVLMDGESPAEARWTLLIAGLLVLFLGFNLWYLSRSLADLRAR